MPIYYVGSDSIIVLLSYNFNFITIQTTHTMQTKFKSLNELKNKIEIGQKIYLENFICPNRSRVAEVVRKQSYFFTVDFNGKESRIINGAESLKHYGFSFNPDFERVDIYTKKDSKPFVSIHFNQTIVKGKENIL